MGSDPTGGPVASADEAERAQAEEAAQAQAGAGSRPTGLLLDLQERAVGVDPAALRFSWIVPMLGDAMQRSYRLQILRAPIQDPGAGPIAADGAAENGAAENGAAEPRAADDGAVVWDSGEVGSAASTGVLVQDLPLAPSSPYWWRVRVATAASDGHALTSGWSEPSLFTTAPDAWPAVPIWAPARSGRVPDWALLRTEVELPDVPVRAAFVEAVGLSPDGGPEGGPWVRSGSSADDAAYVDDADHADGTDDADDADGPRGGRQHVYKLWANGEVVGFGSVRSGDERPRLHTHDLAHALRPGRNALAALCWAQHGRQFAARLVVVLADGTRIEHLTGPDTWQAMAGDALLPGEGNIGGWWYFAPAEDWDLRAEPVGWLLPGLEEAPTGASPCWGPAAAAAPLPAPPSPATVNLDLTVGASAELHPVGPRTWGFDLGREIVGGLRVRCSGRSGTRIGVRLGEQRDEHGRVVSEMPTGNVYEETWTLRDGLHEIEHWGYRAFRYGELELLDGPASTASAASAPPTDVAESLQLNPVILHSPHHHTGAFSSSDPDLDRVHELCRRSIEATTLDLYLDTPARERLPYEGDAYVNQRSQYACERSFALARTSNAYLARRPTWPAEYHLMPVLIGWEDYLATGDDAQLRSDLELWRAVNYDRHLADDGLLHKDPGTSSAWDADLVDWPETCRDGYEFTPVNTVLNAFQTAAHETLARICAVLGRRSDASHHTELAERLRAGIEEQLVRPDGTYRDGVGSEHSAQHANAIPAALGLVPEERRTAVADALAAGGMRMSVYGAQFLLDALFTLGRADDAIALMTARGDRSWLHLIDDLGATIVPEAWDPSLKPNMTYSHVWGTAPVGAIARWVLGVQVVAPGAARLDIAPQPGPLTRFDGVVPTIRGDVSVRFRRSGGGAAAGVGGCASGVGSAVGGDAVDGDAVGDEVVGGEAAVLEVSLPANTVAMVRFGDVDREVGPGATRIEVTLPR